MRDGSDRFRTKVISVIGLLDSGKSTLIRELLGAVEARGRSAGVVINDQGAVSLDTPAISERHPVIQIGGG